VLFRSRNLLIGPYWRNGIQANNQNLKKK